MSNATPASVWSVFTWYKSQAAQRVQSEYNRKEGLYWELLRRLTVFYKNGPKIGVAPFLEQYRLSWLYAPDGVVRILNSLAENLKVDPAEAQMTDEQGQRLRHDRDHRGAEAIAQLVAAIRRDLFETAEKKTELSATEFGHYS